MLRLTWEGVLARKDLIGGDVETQEGGTIYRGPLSAIVRKGDLIYFYLLWCARRNPVTEEWQKWDKGTSLFVNEKVQPQDFGEGRVLFSLPYLGVCTMHPKDGGKLDPTRVKDLPPRFFK